MKFIDNGLHPDRPYSMQFGVNRCFISSLPAVTPYGNIQLKLMRIEQLTHCANARLGESADNWNRIKQSSGFVMPGWLMQHKLANEQAVYLIRRATDEIITLIWLLHKWEFDECYPSKLKVDCVGAALAAMDKDPNWALTSLLRPHRTMLDKLNPISNAFKHSFLQSDVDSVVGRDEPCIFALSLDHNDSNKQPEFRAMTLDSLVMGMSVFYNAGLEWLRAFANRHSTPTTTV